ncbi:MAG: four helix bundle protein [Patescibacteria group bacterium]
MIEGENSKRYDLEDRTLRFATSVRNFVRKLPKTISSIEDAKQLVRSSGSVGANYIEACEALSKKDFLMRIKICRKEAKESGYWLNLLETPSIDLDKEKKVLIQEATELKKSLAPSLQSLNFIIWIFILNIV